MRRTIGRLSVLLLAGGSLIGAPAAALAATSNQGLIQGNIYNTSGQPAQGTKVAVFAKAG
ncbi:5-hydroxyisourate hydrolase (fragment) [Nostocoides japonicum T1-X7]|uniref:5-hydroxyisourate hydrolase n=1 Tax=Nostocoides japonicum T1-X7 TaxID=1194083 RepID=A0A077LYI3_9MICO